MTAIVMDGTTVANRLLSDNTARTTQFEWSGPSAGLPAALVGDDPSSFSYVRMKAKRRRAASLNSESHQLAVAASTADAFVLVNELVNDDSVAGDSPDSRRSGYWP